MDNQTENEYWGNPCDYNESDVSIFSTYLKRYLEIPNIYFRSTTTYLQNMFELNINKKEFCREK